MLRKETRLRLRPFIPYDLLPGKGKTIKLGGLTTDHTLLAASITGLSAISESLDILGSHGAERLSAILTSLFERLLAPIQQYQGIIISLSCEDIFILFPGTSLQTRWEAISCAAAMRQAMRKLPPVPTPSGETAPKISIALCAGEVGDFRAGHKKRAFRLLSGDITNNLFRSKISTPPDTICLTPSVIQGLEKKFNLHREDQTIKLMDALQAAPLPKEFSAPEDIGKGIEAFLPEGLLQRLTTLPEERGFTCERNYATVMSVNFFGLRQTFKAYNEYVGKAWRIVNKYGGIIKEILPHSDGDRLTALFGTPVVCEDDEKRASLAALELLSIAPAGASQRIGINSGYLFSCVIGSDYRRDFTVTGRNVDLAHAQMQAASEGQIRLGKQTRLNVRSMFSLTCSDPIVHGEDKTKEESYLLGERIVTVDWLQPPQDKLIDRKDELTQLTELLGKVARTKQGQAAIISGEAGIGKTRLVQELASIARKVSFTAAGGRCASYGTEIPYLPWSDLFGTLLAEGKEQVSPAALTRALDAVERPAWAPLLAPYVGLHLEENEFTRDLDPSARKQKMFALALELVAYTAGQNPLLLVFENIQWIDSLSHDLIAALVDLLPDFPLLLVLLTRPVGERSPWKPLSADSIIHLTPLDKEHIRNLLLTRLSADEADPALIKLIADTTKGNPFFIEESLRLLQRSEALKRTGKTVSLGDQAHVTRVPATIHRVISARIDLLNERTKNILRIASVIGQRFEFDILNQIQKVARDEALQRQLSLLEHQGLITRRTGTRETTYEFNNVLTREVVYDSFPSSKSSLYHEKVAKLLEETGREPEQILLHHYSRTEDEEKTLDYLLQSAERATHAYANEEAIRLYEKTLEFLGQNKETDSLIRRFDVLLECERLYARMGKRSKQASSLKALLTIALSLENQQRLAVVLARETAYKYALGDYNSSLNKGSKAHKMLSAETNPFELLGTIRHIAYSLEALGRFDEASGYLNEALALAKRIKDPAIHASVLSDFGKLHQERGDYRQSLEFIENALAIYQKTNNLEGEIRTAGQLGVAYKYLGLFEKARRAYEAALELATKTGDKRSEEVILRNIGIIMKNRGKYEGALEHCERALEIAREIRDRSGEGALLDTIGNIKRAQGCFEEAILNLTEALKIAKEMGKRPSQIRHLSNLANIYIDLGDYNKALELEERTLSMAQNLGARKSEALALLIIGLIKRHQKKPLEGLEATRKAAQMFKKDGAEVLYIETLTEIAQLLLDAGQFERAEAQTEEILQAALAKGLAIYQARALSLQAQIHLGHKDPQAAFFLSSKAIRKFDEKDTFDIKTFFIHFQVLKALGKQREAAEIIKKLHSRIVQKAETIQEPGLVKSYLKNVELNRKIIQEWERLHPTGDKTNRESCNSR